jgi:hypothetical protein
MPSEPTQKEVDTAWEVLKPKVSKAAGEYPKPEGLTYAYGTAGFRMK